jgi:hypothetical protein
MGTGSTKFDNLEGNVRWSLQIYYFERDGGPIRETSGAFESQEAAVRAVEFSYRGRPGDVKDVMARQNPKLTFRQRQAETPNTLLVEVFPDDVSHGDPLATYKVMTGHMAS